MKILFAEDDPNIALIAQLSLEKIGGHDVTHVSDGELALQRARTEAFDLILLDGTMPRRTGLQVAEELRKTPGFNTPIIFLTAKSEEKDIKTFMTLGQGYIAKPFDPQTLSQKIIETLQGQRAKAV